jgi:hypothetical protein
VSDGACESDTISVSFQGQPKFQTATGIAWPTDVDKKFQNPPSFAGTVKPPSWPFPITDLGNASSSWYTQHPNGYGYDNEDFIVWMRNAAFPDFRKLYRIEPNGLSKGTYNVTIDYRALGM